MPSTQRGSSSSDTDNHYDGRALTAGPDQVANAIRAALKAESPKEPFSSRAIVEKLKREIREARVAGLSWKHIGLIFTQKGCPISPDTLRLYTSTATPTKAARGRRRIAQAAGTASAAPTAVETPSSQAATAPGVRLDGARISPRVK